MKDIKINSLANALEAATVFTWGSKTPPLARGGYEEMARMVAREYEASENTAARPDGDE